MEDFRVSWDANKSIFKNSTLLPNSIRGLIIGESESGKTHLLFRMLLQDDFIDYNNLVIFSKSLNQPEYQVLIQGFKHKLSKAQIRKIFENQDELKDIPINTLCEICTNDDGKITVSAFKTNIDVPDPNSMDSSKKNLMIFDDVMLQKQRIIEEYYTKGRHNSTQVFYISQAFFEIPKSTVRGNANLLFLFKLTDVDVANIHRQIVKSDMDLETFTRFCKKVWDKKYKFIVIDRYNENLNLKYRDGFETPLNKILPEFNI